jgi:hypothetical protein
MELTTTLEAISCVATRLFPSILWELSTCPYPEPLQSSPHHSILTLQDLSACVQYKYYLLLVTVYYRYSNEIIIIINTNNNRV